MGNCIGKGGGAREGVSRAPAAPANGIFNRDVLLMQAEHLAATASSAHFASSQVQKTYSKIHKPSTDTLLLAFFEGVGASIGGHRTAALANSLLCETFTESCQRYGDNPEAILRATLQSIHHKCLASPKISHNQPAGASGTLVLLNLTTGHCTVANIGHSRCLLAGVSGSFNSKRPQCTWISTLHTTEDLKERMHAARHSSNDKGAYFDITLPLHTPFAGVLNPNESIFVTRALGLVSEGSRSDSQGRRGAAHDVEVAVSSFYLFPAQDHIVIGSSGFWDLLAPSAVALRSHLFSKFQQAQKEAVQAALNNDAPVPSPAERGPQAAEHLVRFALGTTADCLSTRTGTAITATDLEELPFQRDKISTEDLLLANSTTSEGAAAGANVTSGGQGSDLNLPQLEGSQQMTPNGSLKAPQSQEQPPKELSFDDLIRSDIHKDLGCVVLSLSWRQKGPQENPNPPLRIFHPKRPSEVLNQGYYASDLAPLARFRWAQVRMLVDYHRLYKREVMQRWEEVVQGIMGKAKIRAKAVAERVKSEHGIAVQVTPLMKVKAMDGRPLSADLFNIKASINF